MGSRGLRIVGVVVALLIALAAIVLLNTDVKAPHRDNQPIAKAGQNSPTRPPDNSRASGNPDPTEPGPRLPDPTLPIPDVGPVPPINPENNPMPGPLLAVRLRVRVSLEDGSPAAGALVRIHALQQSDALQQDWRAAPAWAVYEVGRTNGAGELVAILELPTDVDTRRMVKASASTEGYATSYSAETVVTPDDPSPMLSITLRAAVNITGRVVDPGGKPIAGARVMLLLVLVSQQRPHAHAISDSDGRFEFVAAPQHTALVEIRADGFALWRDWQKRFEPTSPRHDLGDLVLQPTGVLIGRCVDSQGKPVPQAAAFLSKLPTSFLNVDDSVVGTQDGRFAFATAYGGPGKFLLLVRAPGFQPAALPDIEIKPGLTTDVGDIKLAPGLELALTVTDSGGGPIAGAQARMAFDGDHSSIGWYWQRAQFRATTDAKGSALITSLSPGPWRIRVSAPGFTASKQELTLSESQALNITLAAGGSVIGVLRAAGNPAPDAQVGLISHASWVYEGWVSGETVLKDFDWTRTTARPTVRTDTAGKFRIADVAPGKYLLLAWDADRRALLMHDGVEVSAGAETSVGDLDFPGVGTLTVEVLRNGQPLPGCELRIEGSGERKYAKSDSAGLVVYKDLQVGDYTLWLSGERYDRDLPHLAQRRVNFRGDARIVLDLPGTCVRLHGRVTLGGAAVFDNVMLDGNGLTLQTAPGALGQYEFLCVPAGEYALSLRGAAGSPTRKLIVAADDTGAMEFSLNLPGGEVSGTVLGADGAALAGVRVALTSREPGTSPHQLDFASTDAGGAFRFEKVWQGAWRVGVNLATGAAQQDFMHEAPATTGLELKLAPGGTLALVVNPRGNAAFSGHKARLRDDSGSMQTAHTSFMPTSGARAEIVGILPGKYTLEIYGTGFVCAFVRDVKIEAGQRTELAVDLPAAATLELTFSGEGLSANDVSQARVTWLDAAGKPVTLPWPYGRDKQRGPLTLEILDLIPEVKQLQIRVPGFKDALVPFEFAPGAKLSAVAALTR